MSPKSSPRYQRDRRPPPIYDPRKPCTSSHLYPPSKNIPLSPSPQHRHRPANRSINRSANRSQNQATRLQVHPEASSRRVSHRPSPISRQQLHTATRLTQCPSERNMPVPPIVTSKRSPRCRSAQGAGNGTGSRWAYLEADRSSNKPPLADDRRGWREVVSFRVPHYEEDGGRPRWHGRIVLGVSTCIHVQYHRAPSFSDRIRRPSCARTR